MKKSAAVLAVMSAFMASGCTGLYDGTDRVEASGSTASVYFGKVLAVKPTTIRQERVNHGAATTVGAVLGAVGGGLLGYNSSHHDHGWRYDRYGGWEKRGSGSSSGAVIGAGVGAVAGGLIGNAIASSADRVDGFAVTVKSCENGEVYIVNVPKNDSIKPGAIVEVIVASDGYSKAVGVDPGVIDEVKCPYVVAGENQQYETDPVYEGDY